MQRPGYLSDWEGFGVHKHVDDIPSFVKTYLKKVKQFKEEEQWQPPAGSPGKLPNFPLLFHTQIPHGLEWKPKRG